VRALSLALIAALLAGCGSDDETVTLALDFQPNAAHAGIYEAEGDDLRILVPSSSTDSLKLLASGRADMAVVDIHDLGLAREGGADVVGVGALVQRPLAAVIAGPDVRRPRDLEGKRVGCPPTTRCCARSSRATAATPRRSAAPRSASPRCRA
jgi:putative hydroxymethylpyrimidine transport system substrate-binding protein